MEIKDRLRQDDPPPHQQSQVRHTGLGMAPRRKQAKRSSKIYDKRQFRRLKFLPHEPIIKSRTQTRPSQYMADRVVPA